ncbi:MAG: hypothetical protein ABJC74_05245 [Gemmatimonadota bacterium]
MAAEPTGSRIAVAGPAAVAVIALLALAASVTSLGNGFAYDDVHIIVNNPHVHSLAQPWHRFAEQYWPPEVGVGLYRPVTILLYAMQWAAQGGQPLAFHLVSVLLYACVAILVLLVARRLLPAPAAFAAAAIWAVHPVHVEAVANVVGQSEIVTALWMLLAVLLYLRAREVGPLGVRQEIAISGLYLLACLSKEHGLVLPALLLAFEFTVLKRQPFTAGLRRFYLQLALIGIAFFAVRTTVLGALAGDLPPYWMTGISTGQRWLTMLAIVPDWIRLLCWPAHLQADYGPRELELATVFGPGQILGLVLLASLAILALVVRRSQPVITVGLAWTAIALLPTSNLLLPTGIALAERTLFLPSVGICMVFGAVVAYALARRWRIVPIALWAVVVAGLIWSGWRQPVWKDNPTLFHQMTLDAPLSYRAHWGYGSMLFDKGDKDQGFRELQIAHSLYDRDSGLLLEMARDLRNAGRCQGAVPLYRQAIAVTPSDELRWGTRTMLILCLLDLRDFPAAKAEARRGQQAQLMASQFRNLERYADSLATAGTAKP